MEKKIEIFKRYFSITVSAFEMQHTIARAFGYKGPKSLTHSLYLYGKKEINKEKPDLKVIENILAYTKNISEEKK